MLKSGLAIMEPGVIQKKNLRLSRRANGERTISHVTAHGGRKSRYKGKKKWQLIMASINHNVKMVMGYLQNKTKNGTSTGELCPQMS